MPLTNKPSDDIADKLDDHSADLSKKFVKDGDDKMENRLDENVLSPSNSKLDDVKVAENRGRDIKSLESSIWCHDGVNQFCRMKNMCYNSLIDEFVVFLDDTSILENVDIIDGAITVDLSSLKNHNNRQLSVSTLPSSVFDQLSATWVDDSTLLFQRFLPENVMHMFHDDIIPLHQTLQLIHYVSEQPPYSPFDVNIFLYEDKKSQEDDINQYFEIFSGTKLIFKNNYYDERLTCFRDMYIGLVKSTVWYDYGFAKYQGPIGNMRVSSPHIRTTAEFVKHRLDIQTELTSSNDYVVVLNRKENRKILNAGDLTLGIVKSLGLKVVNLDLDSYDLVNLISYVSNARGVVGMHGSLMILSMFLQPGAFVVELFPYAVNPDHYTPYKTLCHIKGMNIHYHSWANQILQNSLAHPDWPRESGGITHLPKEEREVIMKQTEVPRHVCCEDPSWLYHIYQDTIVDCDAVVQIIDTVIKSDSTWDKSVEHGSYHRVLPSKVLSVVCVLSCMANQRQSSSCHLNIKWNEPWTIEYLNYDALYYNILVQGEKRPLKDNVISKLSSVNNIIVNVETQDNWKSSKFFVWVQAAIDGEKYGPFSDAVFCSNEIKH